MYLRNLPCMTRWNKNLKNPLFKTVLATVLSIQLRSRNSFTLLFCTLDFCSSLKSGWRNLVREIWFKKSGSRKVVDQKKRWFYSINPPFLWFEKSGWPEKKIRVCRTTFLEPLFYTFLEKWLQIKWLIEGTKGDVSCFFILNSHSTLGAFNLQPLF